MYYRADDGKKKQIYDSVFGGYTITSHRAHSSPAKTKNGIRTIIKNNKKKFDVFTIRTWCRESMLGVVFSTTGIRVIIFHNHSKPIKPIRLESGMVIWRFRFGGRACFSFFPDRLVTVEKQCRPTVSRSIN